MIVSHRCWPRFAASLFLFSPSCLFRLFYCRSPPFLFSFVFPTFLLTLLSFCAVGYKWIIFLSSFYLIISKEGVLYPPFAFESIKGGPYKPLS